MAQAAIPIAATVLNVGSKAVAANAQKKAADSEAQQLEANARRRRMQGKSEAEEILRQTNRMMSDASAIQGASGFSGSDASAIRQIANISGAGKYNELAALYEAEQDALGLERGAQQTRKAGRRARTAGYMGAAATALGSWDKNDGFGLFKRTDGSRASVSTSQPAYTRPVTYPGTRPPRISRVSF